MPALAAMFRCFARHPASAFAAARTLAATAAAAAIRISVLDGGCGGGGDIFFENDVWFFIDCDVLCTHTYTRARTRAVGGGAREKR